MSTQTGIAPQINPSPSEPTIAPVQQIETTEDASSSNVTAPESEPTIAPQQICYLFLDKPPITCSIELRSNS
ncbi:hypothetical protein MJO28_000265 [Puccinia striiformis f. sp. tritici]|uniref:Uncharacterized protein n=1 Tax=Puccinia striiformis f. sp. tritici TaxID=168172 RepID=A0ACC0EXD7_9BASI|nr:hypothetical protein MJO28_000265 [Puccinia striiformis f. sp. tritici]